MEKSVGVRVPLPAGRAANRKRVRRWCVADGKSLIVLVNKEKTGFGFEGVTIRDRRYATCGFFKVYGLLLIAYGQTRSGVYLQKIYLGPVHSARITE